MFKAFDLWASTSGAYEYFFFTIEKQKLHFAYKNTEHVKTFAFHLFSFSIHFLADTFTADIFSRFDLKIYSKAIKKKNLYTNPLCLKWFFLECCVFQPFSTVVVAVAAIEHFSCVISIVSARCLSGHQVFLHFDLHQKKKFWKELFLHKNTIYVYMKWCSCHLVSSYYSTTLSYITWIHTNVDSSACNWFIITLKPSYIFWCTNSSF